MTGKICRLALIGAGGIGATWVDAIASVSGVRIAAVADKDLKRARQITSALPGCRELDDWRDLLTDPTITAAIVATPHAFLAPISHALLASGKHVLCEKPGGISIAEIKKNIAVSKKKRMVYMIGFNHRYHPAYSMAKRLVDEGKIGPLQFIRARYGFGGRANYGGEWRFKRKMSGGGELLDQGVHMIDMARWFMGEFIEVKGFTEDLFWHGEVEDNAFVLLRTKQRQVASIHVSWSNWRWVHSFEVYGRGGYCLIDGLDQRYRGPEKLTVGKRDPSWSGPPQEEEFVFDKENKHDSFARELKDFVESINGSIRPLVSGEDAEKTFRIVERVYRDTNKPVKIEP